MYDPETGFFHDIRTDSGARVKTLDITGWIPCFAGVATRAQAATVRKVMLDPAHFGTRYPFSTLSHDHPGYSPDKGYWRGQIWLNGVYFGIRGFKNYGYDDDAALYTRLLPRRLPSLGQPGMPIRENYNPETGEGLCARNFGWSSAYCILLMVEDGDNLAVIPRLPEDAAPDSAAAPAVIK